MPSIRTLIAALACLVAVNGAHAQENLFQYKGLSYSADDLPPALQQKLYDAKRAYHAALKDILDGAALELYFESLAETQKRSVADVRSELLAAPPPAEALVRQFYDQNKSRIRGTYGQVRGRISDMLRFRAVTAKSAALVQKLSSGGEYKITAAAPRPPIVRIDTSGRPVRGGQNARVTIVEFADFKCPHCRAASPVIEGLVKQYAPDVNQVFMDFPIIRGGASREIAKGGYCAARQNRFWEYHDRAFAKQSETDAKSPARLASALGMDMAEFRACLIAPESVSAVEASRQEGLRVGVDSTPTLFVNGQRVAAENVEADLRAAIEKALAKP